MNADISCCVTQTSSPLVETFRDEIETELLRTQKCWSDVIAVACPKELALVVLAK